MNTFSLHRPVLLVVDVQNDFLDGWLPRLRAKLIGNISEIVEIFRNRKQPIIWVRQEFAPDLSDAFLAMRRNGQRITVRGTRGAEIVAELDPGMDPVVIKKRYSAFFCTELEQVLAKLSPGVLVVAGINTHACIRTTAIDAYQRDYNVIIAADCVGSYDAAHHSVSLRYLEGTIARVLTNPQIACELQSANGSAPNG